ncbi:two-component system response regulator YesN [Fontibacillus phaseoli]|uniref:Two-component system response regulator YesN n=1 Tax=Fontibacillus phaseoli TaxID=1416533 RepID=A0A369AVE7_9BACL|nr:response regulator [Fontibacillus phaseoli]RCX13299.1 two-component system response regulator YesN [Fontibacillus phaseoli]
MIRVLLVDDEPIVRIALRELIPWERFGCEIAGEASNGREALKRIQDESVDLVLVDMQMPLMNGIEFMKELRSLDVGGRIVALVLSAYSDYEYVREAFLYGACDYVIKNDLEESKVSPVIRNAVDLIRAKTTESERKEQEARSIRQKQQEQWLFQAVQSGGAGRSPAISVQGADDGQERFQTWWGDRVSFHYGVGCVLLDRMYGRPLGIQDQQSRFVMHTIRQVVEGYGLEIVMAPLSVLEYAVLVFVPVRLSGQAFRSLFTEIMHKALSHLQQYVNVNGAVGLADPSSNRQDWAGLYRQAMHLAQLRFFRGNGQVFFAEAMPISAAESHAHTGVWNIPRLIRDMEQGNAEWEQELNAGLKVMTEMRLLSVEAALQPYKALLWELSSLLRGQGLGWRQITEQDEPPVSRVEYMNSLAEINEYILTLARQVAQAVHPAFRAAETVPRLVDKVKQWIDLHYNEPLSLTGASEMAGISENYLSKVFAKEMGETFIEYVARKRIETAIQLMKSGMKLYEIGEKVGYPNQGHFTKVFKRVTGKTPLEYRENLR